MAFSREMKAEAKAKSSGLVMITVKFPDGRKVEERGVVTPEGCRFAEWVAAVLFCEQVRALPNLEAEVQRLMSK